MTAPVLLGGIDVFHLMNDRAMRSRGQAGNHCLFVVELEGRLDLGRLAARIDRAVRALPELRWRIDQGPLGVARPRWVVDPRRGAPAPSLREVSGDAELAARIEGLLAARVDGERPWAIDVLRRPGAGDVIVLRHFHALVDARGSDRLMAWIGSGSGDAPDAPPPPEDRFEVSERALARIDRDARIQLAGAYRAHVLGLGRTPILSLASAAGAQSDVRGFGSPFGFATPLAFRFRRFGRAPRKLLRICASSASSCGLLPAPGRVNTL